VGAHAQTFSCPAGTEDMMNYFLMSCLIPTGLTNIWSRERESYLQRHPARKWIHLPVAGAFSLDKGNKIKGINGFPRDIKAFDTKYVYDRATELNWNDPTSFKRFANDLPMSPRCAAVNKAARTIKIPPSKSAYSFYASCQAYNTSNLSYVRNDISAPSVVNVGNVGSMRMRYFRYRYSCDSTYSNCQYMEVFSLGYGVGNYDWKYYINQSGSWVMMQESIIDQLTQGQTTPSLPCTTSYQ